MVAMYIVCHFLLMYQNFQENNLGRKSLLWLMVLEVSVHDRQERNMIEEHGKGKLFLSHFNGEVGGHFREKICLQSRAPVNYFLQLKVTS